MKSINQGFEVQAPITTESGVEEDNQVAPRGEDQMITEAQVLVSPISAPVINGTEAGKPSI